MIYVRTVRRPGRGAVVHVLQLAEVMRTRGHQ